MTQEEKNILLKDISARLPYGVKVQMGNEICSLEELDRTETSCGIKHPDGHFSGHDIEDVKPYLRPMSSMTEGEREEIEVFIFNEWYQENSCKIDKEGWIEILANYDVSGIDPCFCSDYIDWLNAHHFDYRGLIPMGLALEAPTDMYQEE